MATWGDNRKHSIEAALAISALALIVVISFLITYKAPSCIDGKQNQHEDGIDCGGPCAHLCSANEIQPSLRFIRALSPQPGRTDIIAYVDNQNTNASLVNAPVTIDLYDQDQKLVVSRSGFIMIPPSTTEPLYIPNFYKGPEKITQAFLTFTGTSTLPWISAQSIRSEIIPNVTSKVFTPNPKITATITNATAVPLENVKVVATVFDTMNNAIGSSQTIIPNLPAQGSEPVVFTWNSPFAGTPVRVEILRAF